MRAAVLTAPRPASERPLAIVDVPDPEVGREVIVLGHSIGARITLEDVARWQGIGVNDILMSLNGRIPQVVQEA